MIPRPWVIGKAHDAPSLRLGKLPHDSRSTDLGLCTFAFIINLCNANVHMLHRDGIKAEEDKQFANIWNKCELEYNFFCCVKLTNNYIPGDVRERAWATFLASCGCLCQTVRPADLVRGLQRPGTVRWTLFIAFVDCKSTIPDLLQCKCEKGAWFNDRLASNFVRWGIKAMSVFLDEMRSASSQLSHIFIELQQCKFFWTSAYKFMSREEAYDFKRRCATPHLRRHSKCICALFPTSSFCRCQNAHTASLIHPK